MDVAPLVDLCEEGVRNHVFPGASFAVGTDSEAWLGCAGRHTYDPDSPAMQGDSIFDLASLTKVVSTTTAAMLLFDSSLLDLDATAASILSEFGVKDKDSITVRNLLLHDSGLPPYVDLSGFEGRPDEARAAALALAPEAAPGERTAYSCMGFIALQQIIERIAVKPLDAFVTEKLFGPLGMHDTMFRPTSHLRERCVPTLDGADWRGRLLQGEVHDPNAYALGGVSGNAGLFSTSPDLALFCRLMLGKGELSGKRILRGETVESWTRRQGTAPGLGPTGEAIPSTRALGWDTRSERGSSAGAKFSIRSFGHTGYTGTTIWIDPERGIFAVLLTNRVYPDDSNLAIADFRPRFHDLAAELLA